MSERILLIEDDALIADTIRLNILGEVPDAEIVHVRTLEQARAAFQDKFGFDFVYFDLWSHNSSGFRSLLDFKKLFPDQSILIAFRHLTLTA